MAAMCMLKFKDMPTWIKITILNTALTLVFATVIALEPPIITALRFNHNSRVSGDDISKIVNRFIKKGETKEKAVSILRDSGFILSGKHDAPEYSNCIDAILPKRFLFPHVLPIYTHVRICFEDEKVVKVTGELKALGP